MGSIGSMCELKMWDLTTGKCVYQKNSKGREVPIGFEWNPEGTKYAVLYPSHLVCFSAESGEIISKLEDEQLLMYFKFVSNDIIIIGGDAGILTSFSIADGKKIRSIQAHKLRIKGIDVVSYSAVFP